MHRQRWRAGAGLRGLVVALCLMALGLGRPSRAAEFTCAGGDVTCLIDAMNDANANGQAHNTIRLEAGTYTLTTADNDSNGLPLITSRLTMRGAGADATIIEREASAGGFRFVQVAVSGTLTVTGLTLRGGAGRFGGGILNGGRLTLTHSTVTNNSSADEGGGIANELGGTLTLTHSTVTNNLTAFAGGGIRNASGGTVTITHATLADNKSQGGGGLSNASGGLVTITDSTIADNSAVNENPGGGLSNAGTMIITNTTITDNSSLGTGSFGGGIANFGGRLTLANSTVASNSAAGRIGGQGGGILTLNGIVELQNTILALNTAPGVLGPDCFGPVTSLGNNLIGDPTGCTITLQPSDLTGDPGLDAFTDNGTPGNGHFPLLPASPAINAGNDMVCPKRDQLGEQRHKPCDIGAIEFQPPAGHVVAIRQAIFVDPLALLFVVATSSAPDADLFVTVPECLMQVPMSRVKDRYLLVRTVPECGDLDGQTATVTSSRGGMASVSLR